jgi:hypothetical protein
VSLSLVLLNTETDQDRIQNVFYTATKSSSETVESFLRDNKSFTLTIEILVAVRRKWKVMPSSGLLGGSSKLTRGFLPILHPRPDFQHPSNHFIRATIVDLNFIPADFQTCSSSAVTASLPVGYLIYDVRAMQAIAQPEWLGLMAVMAAKPLLWTER